jgi:hypothetical protein
MFCSVGVPGEAIIGVIDDVGNRHIHEPQHSTARRSCRPSLCPGVSGRCYRGVDPSITKAVTEGLLILASVVTGWTENPALRRHFWSVLEKETETSSMRNPQRIVNIAAGNEYHACTIQNIPIYQLAFDYSAGCIRRESCCWENDLSANDGWCRTAPVDVIGNMSSRDSLGILRQRHNIRTQISEDINGWFSSSIMVLYNSSCRIACLRQSVGKASRNWPDPSTLFGSHLVQLQIENPIGTERKKCRKSNNDQSYCLTRGTLAFLSF